LLRTENPLQLNLNSVKSVVMSLLLNIQQLNIVIIAGVKNNGR